jgi:hypothetical protein
LKIKANINTKASVEDLHMAVKKKSELEGGWCGYLWCTLL